jgi:hypothetical protein
MAAAALWVGLSAPADAASSSVGWARFGHYAPTKGPVDLYVDGAKAVNNVAFRQITPYVALPPGPHLFELRDAGAPASATPISVPASISAGVANTVAGVSTHDGITAEIYTDDLTAAAAGQARVRVVDTVPDVNSATISVRGGSTLFSSVSFPTASSYTALAAGTYTLDVSSAGSSTPLFTLQGWQAQAGSLYSLVVVRGPSSMELLPVADAVGAQNAPLKGPRTGMGGTAQRGAGPSSLWAWLAGGAGLAVLMALAAGGRGRRRSRSGGMRAAPPVVTEATRTRPTVPT